MATDVDRYAAELTPNAQTAFSVVRRIIHDTAPELTESIRYQMPCFQVRGAYVVYVGAWKHHIGLYPIPTLPGELETQVAAHRTGADTVRFEYRDPIPEDLVRRVVAEVVRRLPQERSDTPG